MRRRRDWRAWLGALGVALVFGLPVKAPEIVLPIGPDQGTYSYVAERILAGGLPYRDAWDNKPPATYYAHAAVLALAGPHRWLNSCIPGLDQPCAYVALHVADVLWTTATALALFALARQVLGGTPGAMVAVALFAVFANLSQLSREGSTPEKQLLLPMVLAYLAALRRRRDGRLRWQVLAGLLGGVAFLFKQTAISIPLAILTWQLWRMVHRHGGRVRQDSLRAYARDAAALGLAFLLPTLFAFVVLGVAGAASHFWEAPFAYNLLQAGSGSLDLLRGFLIGSWQVFRGSSAALWLLALGGALLALPRAAERTRLALVLAWASFDVLALFLGGAKFAQVYYVQLVPSLAVLGAIAVTHAWRTVTAATSRAYLAAVGLSLFLLSNGFQGGVMLRAWNDRLPPRSSIPPEQGHIATYREVARRGPIFVWGDAAQVYVRSEARSPSRFFHAFPLSRRYVGGTGYLERRRELMAALAANPPVLIAVDPATTRDDPEGSLGLNLRSFPELEALIREGYREMTELGLYAGWKAYERR